MCARNEPREWERKIGGKWSMVRMKLQYVLSTETCNGKTETNKRKLQIFSTYPHFIVYLKDYRTKMHEATSVTTVPGWNKIESSKWWSSINITLVTSFSLVWFQSSVRVKLIDWAWRPNIFAQGNSICIDSTALEKRDVCCVVAKNIHSNMITDRRLSTLTRKKVSQLVLTCVRAAKKIYHAFWIQMTNKKKHISEASD